MFNCREITEHASRYLERDMRLWDRVRFRLHLFICVNCRRYVRQTGIVIGALRGLRPPVADDTQTNAVLHALQPGCCHEPHEKD